ncbi:MAG: nicotinamide riboside transporter PnuC [Bacteroidales bacterium]|nr:nicotinamide riboside transporter PnuC [Bacteroidales bacterium]
MEIFNINHTLFILWGYNVCLLELVGVVLGVCSVWLATQGKAVNFLVGIVGMSFLGVFFYQKGLYSSLILQIILICFCAYGYYNWTKPKKGEKTANQQKKITLLTHSQRLLLISVILLFVGIWGSMMVFAKPDFLKVIFPENYSHFGLGYADSYILIVAMLGMYLRTQKKYENWFLFLSSDTMGIILYTLTGAYFVVLMCSIYWLLDIKAIISWRKEMKSYNS